MNWKRHYFHIFEFRVTDITWCLSLFTDNIFAIFFWLPYFIYNLSLLIIIYYNLSLLISFNLSIFYRSILVIHIKITISI